ncbi:MAG: hypothetical protein ACK4NV_00855 [Pannonibacter sp.]|jgi:hypothetical protein
MSQSTIDLEFVLRQQQQVLDELRLLRKDVSDIRSLAVQAVEYSRRIERRVSETRDDIEVMLKAELSGRLAHLETRPSKAS